MYWLYKAEEKRREHEEQLMYEVARFEGVLVVNPKLLDRLTEVLPFPWEKGLKSLQFIPKKQTVAEMKEIIIKWAGASKKKKK